MDFLKIQPFSDLMKKNQENWLKNKTSRIFSGFCYNNGPLILNHVFIDILSEPFAYQCCAFNLFNSAHMCWLWITTGIRTGGNPSVQFVNIAVLLCIVQMFIYQMRWPTMNPRSVSLMAKVEIHQNFRWIYKLLECTFDNLKQRTVIEDWSLAPNSGESYTVAT